MFNHRVDQLCMGVVTQINDLDNTSKTDPYRMVYIFRVIKERKIIMKVILLQDVKSLGKKGELVEVSEGYGRNFLLPRNIAKEANAQAMNEYKNAENSKKYKIDTAKAQAESYKKQLEGKTFKMTAKAGKGGKLFGSITAKQVAEEIKKQYNISVDKRKVVLERDIKEFGTYKAEVKLYTGISAQIDIQVSEA